MFASSKTPPRPLPVPDLEVLRPGLSLLKPLCRRGDGPGLIVLCPETADPLAITDGVPWPLLKWAEEGYTVVEIQPQALSDAPAALKEALAALKSCPTYVEGKLGIVAYSAALWNGVAAALAEAADIVAAVVYAEAAEKDGLAPAAVPQTHHLGGPTTSARLLERAEGRTRYYYPQTRSSAFATPRTADFDYAAEAVSHTRNLSFLKPLMQGPYFDLETIWEEHTFYEFEDRSVEHTMSTMVQEPYVNHIPTLTGGIGRDRLTNFYRHHFIFNNPDDTELELISRTVGIDRVIDEFIYKFTHNSYVDWMIPGIPPTHKRIEAPFTAIVNIRGDRLYHEHIAWDQGTVLAQLGLLPEYLPYPYAVPGQSGKKHEYRLPVAGLETAAKLREKNAEPSNRLLEYAIREVREE